MKPITSSLRTFFIFLTITTFIFTALLAPEKTSAAFAPSIDGVSASGSSLTLTSSVKILMDPNEPPEVKKAVEDLRRDMEWVLGTKPPLVSTIADLGGKSGVIVSYEGAATAPLRDTALTGEENHKVFVKSYGGKNHLVLQGSDPRGAIYAIYTFSDKFLGVPPLWYWSNWQPMTKSSITIPSNGGVFVATAQTKYRAWFLNNQDLWLGWNTPNGVDKYDLLFETMLRLKLNTYYIGEQVGEYGGGWLEKAQQAQNRGLQLAANDLAQFRQWNKFWTEIRGTTAPTLSLANQDKFPEFWKYSLQYAKDNNLDVVWVLGFRGDSDGGFWEVMTDAPSSDSARGDVIEEMTQKQMQAVREVYGTQDEKMAFLLWNELTDLAVGNNLQLPQDPDLIWIFGNDIRDHFPRSDALTMPLPSNQPFGYYMNLQFTSTGSHLVEGEGPWKASENFKLLQVRKPGQRMDFGYFNVGNVREFLLTAAVSSEMLWNIGNYNPDTTMQKTLGRYFGSTNAASLTTLYKRMLDAYYQQKANDLPNFQRQYIFHDLRIKEAMDKQLDQIRARSRNLNPFNNDRMRIDHTYNGTSSQVGAVMTGSLNATNSLKTLVSDLQTTKNALPPSSHVFFTDTFLAPSMFLRDAYLTLWNVTRSHFKVNSGLSESYCYLKDAKDASASMRASLIQTAHAPFTTWYSEEDIFNLTAIDTEIQQTLATLPQTNCTTPTPTQTPSPTPAPITQSAYPSTSGLKTSNVLDGKRTLLKAKGALQLSQIACYNCGSGTSFILYNSNSSGALLSQVLSGQAHGTTSSWSFRNVAATLTNGNYYVLQFTPATKPVYFGSSAKTYTDLDFLKYATVGASNWKTGSFHIRLTYTK